MRLNKIIKPFFITLFIPLLIYLYTAPRYPVSFGDSDELTTAGFFLGLPHPPGYPLINFLIHFFTHLPINVTVAFKANLVSIISATLAISVFYLLIKKVASYFFHDTKGVEVIALSLSLFLSFTRGYWTYATVAEVFSLNILFALLIIYLTLELKQKWQNKYFYLFCCIVGMGISHQQLIILFLIPSIILLWNEFKKHLKHILKGVLVIIAIPILLYTLLFLTANQYAPQSWRVGTNLSDIKAYLLREDYASNQTGGAYLSDVINGYNFSALGIYINDIIKQIGLPLLLISLIGIYLSSKLLPKAIFYYLLIIFLFTGPLLGFYLTYPQPPTSPANIAMVTAITQRMYLMSYPLWIIWITFTFFLIFKYKQKLLFLIVLLPIIQFASNIQRQDLASYQLSQNYSHNILLNLPTNAVLACFSDISCFSLRYAQSIDNIRPDISIIPVTAKLQNYSKQQSPQLFNNIYNFNPHRIASIISWALYQQNNVYIAEILPDYIDFMGLDGEAFYLTPKDLVFQITRIPMHKSTDQWQNFTYELDQLKSENLSIQAFKLMLFEQFSKNGTLYARLGLKSEANLYYQKALELEPLNPVVLKLMQDLSKYNGDMEYKNITKPVAFEKVLNLSSGCENNLQCILHYYQIASFINPANLAIRQRLIELYTDLGNIKIAEEENNIITNLLTKNTPTLQ